MNEPQPRELFRERASRFELEAAGKRGSVTLFSWLRLAAFLALVVVLWSTLSGQWGYPGWLGVIGLVGLFTALVAAHRSVRRRLRRVELMAEFNHEMEARLDRNWDELPEPLDVPVGPDHDYASDLDLLGPASLLHLLNTCGTAPGWATLSEWILAPADAERVARRQEAVRELAGAVDFRDALAAEGRLVDRGQTGDVEQFFKWAEGDPWLVGRRRWLLGAAFVFPVINVTVIALYWVGLIPTPAMVWPLLISNLLVFPMLKGIHGTFSEADGGEAGVREHGRVFGLIAGSRFKTPMMVDIVTRLGAGERPVDEEISTLRRLLDFADVRRSPLFHIPLAVVLLWDVHVLLALERWRRRAGPHVRDWTLALGEAEAISALGALAHAHPQWSYPTLDNDVERVEAEELGHPLLQPEICVANDVALGPPGRFLLVTGSNMSGKSTLLRAVGLNAVLAQAGAPVCAQSLTLPPLRVCTSMRVDDSLAGGVSFFMAELRRLKQVVDVAEGGGATLYLLDEILQGTNSAERRVAARAVIRRLLDSGAIGAVTTHDLTLADAEDLAQRADPVHFTEMVGGGQGGLSFDYELRPGLAESTNALKLLDLVGLGQEAVLESNGEQAES
ncbi:MAG: MutS-related protein [Longimicrobiales bacterium]